MADTKKLVRAFLVLGTLVSLIVLSFSSFIQTANQNIQANNSPAAENETSQYPQNAFTSPGALSRGPSPEARLLAEKSLPPVEPSSNLTDNLAQNLAREVMVANPEGVQVGSDGQTHINPPDTGAVRAQLAADPELKNLKIPDWDKEAETLASQILKNQTQSKDNYNAAVSQLLNKYFTPYVYGLVSGSGVSASDLSPVKNAVDGALRAALQTETPENFYNLHKSFVKLLVYEKNALALVQEIEKDPLETTLIFQAERLKYDLAVQEFRNELQKSPLVGVQNTTTDSMLVALFRNILGIKTAHAQWVTFDPSNFAQMLWDEIKSIVLQVLKNIIVMEFQNHVLKFIQHNGDARFIRNWASTLTGAYALGAGSAAQKISPTLCSSFGPMVMGNLMPSYGLSSAGMSYGNCPLEKLTNGNPNNFYGDFSQGGWLAYGASILPSSNYYGSLFASANQLERAAQQAQDVEKTKSVANQGFKSGGQQAGQCGNPIEEAALYTEGDDESQANAINDVTNSINEDAANGYTQVQPTTCADGTCSAVLCPKSEVAAGQLAENINNPGQAIKSLLDKTLGSSEELTVNANSWEGVFATIVGSFINSVLTSEMSSLLNVSPSAQNTSAPLPSGLPSMPATACNPPSETVSIGSAAMFAATGGDGLTFSWTSRYGTPSTNTGPVFRVSYDSSHHPPIFPLIGYGMDEIKVTGADNKTATCQAKVEL